jgi:hypothetical protein
MYYPHHDQQSFLMQAGYIKPIGGAMNNGGWMCGTFF